MYDHDYFLRADGIRSWRAGNLKFGDAMAALSYAHGITWDQLMDAFPWYFEIHPTGRLEVVDRNVLPDQIEFLQSAATRVPQGVLEIGGGRGEIANVLKHMNVPVTSIEVCPDAKQWFDDTGKQFFGKRFKSAVPLVGSIEQVIDQVDLTQFDTIIMIDTIEHIEQEVFDPIWERIVREFHGLFVVANWIEYHPIKVGRYAKVQEHCRLVDDELYDAWSAQAQRCVYRNRSHLVLEF
jgi:hypothetical protein